MNSPAAIFRDPERPSLGWVERLLLRHLDTLARLANVVLRLAGEPLAVGRGSSSAAMLKAARRIGRIDWAWRMVEALGARLGDDLARLRRGEAVEIVVPAPPPPARPLAARQPVGEGRERGGPVFHKSVARLLGRGFSDRHFSKLLERPVEEVIARICKALGLTPDWLSRQDEATETDDAQGGDPSRAPGPRRPEPRVDRARSASPRPRRIPPS